MEQGAVLSIRHYKETDAKASKLSAHCGRVRERLVKLFSQHGFSDGLKTVEGLRKELIDGVIFSPRDITPEKLRECTSKCTESAPASERLFDPQYYATLSALDPLSRTVICKKNILATSGRAGTTSCFAKVRLSRTLS